jgi:RNA polymerase sigma factor (sigma-70 family)
MQEYRDGFVAIGNYSLIAPLHGVPVADTRLTGLLRRLHTGLVPAPNADRDALRAFIAHKDESAFAVLVQRHGPMVLRVCQRVLHHAEDAEDAFQATFLVLARKAESIGRSDALSSWLHGVAFRTALRAKRDARRRRARERQSPVSIGPDPAETLAWRDVQILLDAEIRRLPERYRAAFVLCHLDGRTRAEAAAELGIEENTLSSRLARARERLQARLARRGINLTAVLAAVGLTTGSTAMALPTALFDNTIRAACLFATRQPPTGISSFALQLTDGTIQTMAMTKMKWAVGALAIGGTLAVGTWGAGQGLGPPQGPRSGPPTAGESPEDKPAAVDRSADYAQRQRSLGNLKKIVLAMHNYESVNGQFPTDVTDRTGKTLLSWRVELLPYLDQDDLYKQIKRNESWDSEHNLKLLATMPEVFRVGFEPKGATHTYYQRFVIAGFGAEAGPGMGEGGGIGGPLGPGLPPPGPMGPPIGPPPLGPGGPLPVLPGAPGGPPGIPGAGPGPGFGPVGPGAGPAPPMVGPRFPLRMAEITDGTSNTLGVVEAGPPVPWTKPVDIVYDRNQPLPPLTGPFANVRNAATLDGIVHGLRPNLDATTLRRLIEPNDGLLLPEVKTLRARFAVDTEEEKKALARMVEENEALMAAIEKQIAEQSALLALINKSMKDLDRAEEQQDHLRRMLDTLKVKNKKLRDEVGLRPGAPVPKK